MSGELSDVLGGDTIAAGFTNSVKDRTVMRYATAVERDTLIPAPVEGDMAFLRDVDELSMFRNGIWGFIAKKDSAGNINIGDKDFITSAPGSFQGPGAGIRLLEVTADVVAIAAGPSDTSGVIPFVGAFTDTSKMVLTIIGNANNAQSERVFYAISDLTVTGFTINIRAGTDVGSGGNSFFRWTAVEYW